MIVNRSKSFLIEALSKTFRWPHQLISASGAAKRVVSLMLVGMAAVLLSGCEALGYCEDDGRYYYLDDDGVETSFVSDDPGGPRYCPAVEPGPDRGDPIVVPEVWLLTSEADGNWCILAAGSHPSVEQQQAKCFPGETWVATHALCSAPIYDDGTSYGYWPCDKVLEEFRMRFWGSAIGDGRVGLDEWREINARHQSVLKESEQ